MFRHDGGGGQRCRLGEYAMATLTITTNHDYSGDALIGITDIIFSTSSGANADFASSQFDGTHISNSVNITADGHVDSIGVHLSAAGTFSAAGWALSNWSGLDGVTIIGTSGADTITGSSGNDGIIGGGGADSLGGGSGIDRFQYLAPGDIAAGETVDGGPGTDVIDVIAAGSYDFSGITLTSIEQLLYEVASTVTLAGTQLGTGKIATISGFLPNAKSLIVNGSSVDLSAVSFFGWTAGTDTVTINGTAGADTLTGSSQNDAINGGHGADTLVGGHGADTLAGGADADKFVFDAAALADATLPLPISVHITDFDAGNSGAYNFPEGDQVDLSALLGNAFANGQPVDSLARVVASGSGANLQVDPDGAANGVNFVTIARLDGIHAGNQVNVIVAQPAGTAITAQAALGFDQSPLSAVDFNGDSKSDILLRNDNGTVATWDMNDHTYSGAVIASVSNEWHIVGTGDFNGDHNSDILWRDDGTLAVATWDMYDHAYVPATIGTVATSWHVVGTGDFNGDHMTDILWHNDNGMVATWDMNDHTYSCAVIGTISNDWHIVA
jgi:hypothetical protein